MGWLRVTLEVNGELAEAVADVLSRHVPGGVALEGPAPDQPSDRGLPSVTVSAYLPDDPACGETRAAIERDLWYLSRITPLPPPRFLPIADQDWADAWKVHYRPIPIGRRLLISPSWLQPADPERILIALDPGMAFGSGTHPSTQMCLEALEDQVRPGDLVADLGCGSGILAIAAAKLGATRVLALDIDQEAVRAARSNAAENGVADGVDVIEGSLEDLLGLLPPPGQPDLLLANILAPTLTTMLEHGLAEAVRPGGRLVLSGILAEQLDPLLDLARQCRLRLDGVLEMQDWRTPVLIRPPLPG